MKNIRVFFVVLFVSAMLAANAYSQSCDSQGRINGIFYTSCFGYNSTTDGTITINSVAYPNDRARLQRALNAAIGKLVFNEAGYYIDDQLTVSSYRTLIGTGRAAVTDPTNTTYPNSRIVQTANNKPIFKIGGGVQDVAIRDLVLAAYPGMSSNTTVGILAENGSDDATSALSFDFEFTNLSFVGLDKGIYVNAKSYSTVYPTEQGFGQAGFWRFDNVKLDHAFFQGCRIGVHVNSNNSGWAMKNIFLYMPSGSDIPLPSTDSGNPGGIQSGNLSSVSVGLYLQQIAYSTIEEVIGDGNNTSALIYVNNHANLNIQSTIDEGFRKSIYIFGGSQNNPINLTNNYFQSPVIIRNSYVVSTANQFNFPTNPTVSPAKAVLSSKVFSFGDKFCFGTSTAPCSASSDGSYETDATSQVMFSSNEFINKAPSLRIGTNYYFDIARNVYDGYLEFIGNQDNVAGYSGYSFKTPGGTAKINNDGSVTYGSKNYNDLVNFTNLISASPNGTVIYCTDCQKATPCGSGGSGALAKRINGSWDCN